MAISHACTGCGLDLARRRAPPDPVYGLGVVVCPRCGRAVVRVRRSVEDAWRRARRTARSVFAALAQLAVCAGLLVAAAGAIVSFDRLAHEEWFLSLPELARAALDRSLPEASDDPDAYAKLGVLSASVVCGGVGAGAWFRSGLAHWRRPLALLTYATLLALAVCLEPVGTRPVSWAIEVSTASIRDDGRSLPRPPRVWEDHITPARLGARLALVAGASALTFAGAPIGRTLALAWRQHERSRRRAHRLARRTGTERHR